MACLRTAAEIRERLRTFGTLDLILDVLRCVYDGRRVTAKTLDRQFTNIRAILKNRPTPPHERLHEAVQAKSTDAPKDWASWFRRIVKDHDLDDLAIAALAGTLERELDNICRFWAELPPQVAWKLQDEDPVLKRDSWGFRVRLVRESDTSALDASLRAELAGVTEPEKHFRTCTRWAQVRPFLYQPCWTVDWPNSRAIERAVTKCLEGFAGKDDFDFSATRDLVENEIRLIVVEQQPTWLDDDPLDDGVQAELLASIRSPPIRLQPVNLPGIVQERLCPLEVPHELINETLSDLLTSGYVQIRKIRYTPAGSATERTDRFFIHAKPDAKTAPEQRIDRQPYAANIFRRNGDSWELRFRGKPERPVVIRDLIAMGYIHQLLGSPRRSIAAGELERRGVSPVAGPTRPPVAAPSTGEPERVIDDKTRKSCKKRVSHLLELRKDAIIEDDLQAVEGLDGQISKIKDYISGATDIHGHPRTSAKDEAEMSRKRVSRNLNTVYQAMKTAGASPMGDLVTFLRHAIKPGLEFRYDPNEEITWLLD